MNRIFIDIGHVLRSKGIVLVTPFAIAMGMLESAVVVYLRELYYPEGFAFPLKETSGLVAITELLRELATIIMLLTVGILTGKNKMERFAFFIYSFAIWDIFYYVFLKMLLDWPATFSDWDVLFLLPLMWVGPVWAPVLLSVAMMVLALLILYFSRTGRPNSMGSIVWAMLISGSIVVIITFCKDFFVYMTSNFPAVNKGELFFSQQTFEYAKWYTPLHFETGLFFLGFAIILGGIIVYVTPGKLIDKIIRFRKV